MYSLHSAHVRVDRRNDRWEKKDLSNSTLQQLRTNYDEIWLFIDHYSFDAPRALYYQDVVQETYDDPDSLTLTEWLSQVGNQTLPFRGDIPRLHPDYVKYVHAWNAGYTFTPVGNPGTTPQGGSRFDKADLKVQKDDVDTAFLGRHALFSVNGFYHPTDWGPHGVYILGGNHSLRHANDNQIGLLSFEDVGGIHCLPITPDMVTGNEGGVPLSKGAYVTIPDAVNLENKTTLLVVGGYLQVLGKTYTRISDRTYRIQLEQLQLLERYYDSREYIDFSSLGLDVNDDNPSLVSVDQFFQDDVLRAFLTLPQSFIVVVDAPRFFHELQPLEQSGYPGRYYSHTENHQYPVIGAYGKTLEYHPIFEDGVTVIATTPNRRHNYDFYRQPWASGERVDAGRYPAWPHAEGQAYTRLLGIERY
jgi:hypothetical protein